MGFGGSAASMIETIKRNKAMLRERRSWIKGHDPIDPKQIKSADQMGGTDIRPSKELLETIRETGKRDRRMKLVKVAFGIVVLGLIIFVLFPLIPAGDPHLLWREPASPEFEAQSREFRYNANVDEGFRQMEFLEYKIARHRFRLANHVFPDRQRAQYGIVLTYLQECESDPGEEICDQALDRAESFIRRFPEGPSTESLKLRLNVIRNQAEGTAFPSPESSSR